MSATAEREAVLTERVPDTGVLCIKLDRPEVLNALDRPAMQRLADLLENAADDERTRCVILCGAGSAFCTGADLRMNIDRLDDAETRAMLDAASRVITAITQTPIPVIAEVQGAATGIGASIAFASDLVVAADTAYFLLPFVAIGLMPDGGATATVAASIGRARALRMALRAERLTAASALSEGLIAHVCPEAELSATAHQWAMDLARGSRGAIAAAKAAINTATLGDLTTILSHESAMQRSLLTAPDFAEGVSAFRQKRPPTFAS